MKTYKYFGQYLGHSYGSFDLEYMTAFSSIVEAKQFFEDFQSGAVTHQEFRMNAESLYVPWDRISVFTPGVTDEDYVIVHGADRDNLGQYTVHAEPLFKVQRGVHGATVVEKF